MGNFKVCFNYSILPIVIDWYVGWRIAVFGTTNTTCSWNY